MVIPEEQKGRWESYVEENPDLTSLSQLVRQAVEAEINRDDSSNTTGDDNTMADGRLSEVLETTQTIKSQVENVEDRLYGIEQAVRENPEISELAADLFEILPTREELNNYHTGSPPGPNEIGAGTMEAFADQLGEDEYRVQQALEKLQDEIALVYSTSDFGDENRYYKRE